MRQALHIFNKDVRHLRWEITLVLVQSLFAAKILFLLTFITLPLIVSDSVILGMAGFSPAEHLSGLLWEQVLRWMVLIAPAMAVAAITTGIAEQAGSLLLGLAFFFCVTQLSERGFSDWGVREWIRTSIAVGVAGAGAAGIVVLQYLWRRTMPARIAFASLVALGTLLFLLPPIAERPIDAAPSLHVRLDRSIPPRTPSLGQAYPQADLPLRVEGLPEGLTPWASEVLVSIPGIYSGVPVKWEVVDGSGIRQLMGFSQPFLDRIKNTPVRIHTSVTLTLVRNRQTTTASRTGLTVVPQVGLCNPFLLCQSPFRTPPVVVANNWTGRQTGFTSYSPFPAEFGISPIVMLEPTRRGMSKPTLVTVTTAEPVAHLHFDFDIDNVRLADFEVH